MRLIDADALIEALQNKPNYSIELPSYMEDAIRKLVSTHHAMVIDVIEKQPTAYDVEKVVELINRRIEFLDALNKVHLDGGNFKGADKTADRMAEVIAIRKIVEDGVSDEP